MEAGAGMNASPKFPGDDPSASAGEGYYTFSPSLAALETPARSDPAVILHQMAAELLAQQVDQGRRGVAICGPSRGVGVTLIATNLAIAIARAGVSVLLVDANLHTPGVDALIKPSLPPIGLQQLLMSPDESVAEVIHQDVLPGLSVLYSGGPADAPSDLIGSKACEGVIGECLRDYEYTIVDTPAANRSADARRLAGIVGYGLIVARRNLSYLDDVATLAGELTEDRANVVATLLNDA